MKSPNSIEVNELQSKIDRKLNEIRKRKLHYNRASTKTKNNRREFYQIKWIAIKRHIQRQLQITNKNHHKNLKVIRPSLNSEDLLDVVNRILLLQKKLIELSTVITNYRRLQLLCIFFQCSLSIVFNAYNLVVFLLKMANQADDVPLSLTMLLFFYGYHITSSLTDIIFSVMTYNGVFESIRKTASKMDELNMYIFDSVVNARISQLTSYVFNNLKTFTLFGLYNIDGTLLTSIISGSTTYIIILIQYSGNGEICQSEVNLNLNDTKNHV